MRNFNDWRENFRIGTKFPGISKFFYNLPFQDTLPDTPKNNAIIMKVFIFTVIAVIVAVIIAKKIQNAVPSLA